MLRTLPNNTSGRRMFTEHEEKLPSCCPVSKNPQPGSWVKIRYRARALVLDVITIPGYLQIYRGGRRDAHGVLIVRDMESMLQWIADDCAQVVGVPVRLSAYLELLPKQQMRQTLWGYPQSEVAS